jgi:hypothetical protein
LVQTPIINPKNEIWKENNDKEQLVKGKNVEDFNLGLIEVPENED